MSIRTAIVRHMTRPSLLGLPVRAALGFDGTQKRGSTDATRILVRH